MQKLILHIINILINIIVLTIVVADDEENPLLICNSHGESSKLSKRFQLKFGDWVGTQVCGECEECSIKKHAKFDENIENIEEIIENGGFLTDYTEFEIDKQKENNKCQKIEFSEENNEYTDQSQSTTKTGNGKNIGVFKMNSSRQKLNLTNNPIEMDFLLRGKKIEVNIGDEILYFTSDEKQHINYEIKDIFITGYKTKEIKIETIDFPYSNNFDLKWAKKRDAEVKFYFELIHPTFFSFALLVENKQKLKLDYLTNKNNMTNFG
uniref:Uncharacterized protein n=1 Tax=Meloidogyne hapla TaxID=6305 RepID=A0A1I8BAQ1_MELHA